MIFGGDIQCLKCTLCLKLHSHIENSRPLCYASVENVATLSWFTVTSYCLGQFDCLNVRIPFQHRLPLSHLLISLWYLCDNRVLKFRVSMSLCPSVKRMFFIAKPLCSFSKWWTSMSEVLQVFFCLLGSFLYVFQRNAIHFKSAALHLKEEAFDMVEEHREESTKPHIYLNNDASHYRTFNVLMGDGWCGDVLHTFSTMVLWRCQLIAHHLIHM